jgi:hypothetical protein
MLNPASRQSKIRGCQAGYPAGSGAFAAPAPSGEACTPFQARAPAPQPSASAARFPGRPQEHASGKPGFGRRGLGRRPASGLRGTLEPPPPGTSGPAWSGSVHRTSAAGAPWGMGSGHRNALRCVTYEVGLGALALAPGKGRAARSAALDCTPLYTPSGADPRHPSQGIRILDAASQTRQNPESRAQP